MIWLKPLHLKGFISSPSYKDWKLIDEVSDNKNIINVIKEDIYKDNIGKVWKF